MKPYISVKDVRALLKTMANGSEDPPATLCALALVDERLVNPDYPQTDARHFALFDLIKHCVGDKLLEHRQLYGRDIAEKETIEEAHENIFKDAGHDSSELLNWSFLYYCHIRVDLKISPDDFAELIHVVTRSVRRYRGRAAFRLTQTLIALEEQARRTHRNNLLMSRFPDTHKRPFVGHNDLLKAINRQISLHFNSTFLIVGQAGIGKTRLVQAVLSQYLDDHNELHQLVWITRPATIQAVYTQLEKDIIQSPNINITLREWMLTYRLCVVLDGCELIQSDINRLNKLLEFLNPALIFVINSVHCVLKHVDQLVLVGELDKNSACELIANQGRQYNLSQRDILQLYEITGGNPSVIKLVVQNELFDVKAAVVSDLYEVIISKFDTATLQTWFCFALCPPIPIHSSEFAQVWPQLSTHIAILQKCFLIETLEQDLYRLSNSARYYIQMLYSQYQHVFDAILNELQASASNGHNIANQILDYIHTLNWLDLSAINQMVNADDALDYAITLRNIGQWDDALNLFHDEIKASGMRGDFLRQAVIQIEMNVIYRSRGEYQNAIDLNNRALRTIERYHDKDLLNRAILQRAQIMIECNQPDEAIKQIARIEETNPQVKLLEAEALLMQGNFRECRQIVQNVLQSHPDNHGLAGRCYNLLGRCAQALNDHHNARLDFTQSLYHLEKTQNPFGLARCLSNLGASLIELNFYAEAKSVLNEAKTTQQSLGDKIGLIVTQRNLRLLKQSRS